MKIRAAEIPSVYEKILVAWGFPGKVRTADIAADFNDRGIRLQLYKRIGHIAAEEVLYSEFQRFGLFEGVNVLTVVNKGEGHLGAGKRNAVELFDDML